MNSRLAWFLVSGLVLQACNCGGKLIDAHDLCRDEPARCEDKNFDPLPPAHPTATGTPSVMPPCQTDEGSVQGRVCATDQMTWVNGAAVTIDATDCEGQPVQLTATSGTDGSFTLDQVPAGTWTVHAQLGAFSQDIPVTVTAGQTLQIPDNQLCVAQRQVKIAVVTGAGDKIEDLLTQLNLQYTTIGGDSATWASQAEPFLSNLNQMKQYDLIFFDCAAARGAGATIDFGTNAAQIENNLHAYVQQGGSIYASDWALLFVLYAAPGGFSFMTQSPSALIAPMDTKELMGYAPQTVTANIVDPGLQGFMQKNQVSITFPKQTGAVSLHWGLMNAVPGSTVLAQADGVATCKDSTCSATGQTLNAVPLAVKVKLTPQGQRGGNVLYTSFHNIAQSGGDVGLILKYLVLSL